MQLNQMTKIQLEEIGRKNGIELDRRKKKASLIKELNASGRMEGLMLIQEASQAIQLI